MTSSKRPRGSRTVNIRLILAFIIAAIVAGGFFYLRAPQPVVVLMAATTIEAGQPLTEADFVPVDFEAKDLPDTLLQPGDEVEFLGKVATTTIHAGSLLQRSDFYVRPLSDEPLAVGESPVLSTSWSQLLGPDDHAVAIQGDPTTSFVRAGDVVDLFYVYENVEEGGGVIVQQLFTRRVLFAIPTPLATADGGSATGTVVVIRTNAKEAQDLIFAQQTGELRVAVAAPTVEEDPIEPVDARTVSPTTAASFEEDYNVTLPESIGEEAAPTDEPTEEPSESGLPVPSEEPQASPEETPPGLP